MLEKGTDSQSVDLIREDMFSKIDTGSDIIFRRMGGEGEESGKVVSAGFDEVGVSIGGTVVKVKYVNILDYR